MNFMGVVALFLDADGCGAGREDDAVLLPFGQRDFEEAHACAVIELRPETLPFVERLELLLRRFASCFVIPGIVGLLRGGIAPSLERLAQKHAASRRRSGDQRITFAEFATDQRAASCADGVPDNARRTNARAAREHRAREK